MLKTLFFVTLLTGVLQSVYAGDQTGKITAIRVSSQSSLPGNPTHFQLDGIWSSKPSCVTGGGWWAIDTDTVSGKSLLSILLTAYTTGKSVHTWGAGRCDIRNDMETVFQIGFL